MSSTSSSTPSTVVKTHRIFTASAPAKLILFGEHSVVHNQPALAVAINLRTNCCLKETGDDSTLTIESKLSSHISKFSIQLKEISTLFPFGKQIFQSVSSNQKDSKVLQHSLISKIESLESFQSIQDSAFQSAVTSFLVLYSSLSSNKIPLKGITISITSTIPVGAGLGSSSAFNTSLATVLLSYFGYIPSNPASKILIESKNIINIWAFLGEQIIHGTPSGIDNTVATFGNAIKFTKQTDDPNIMKPQSIPPIPLLVVNTNQTRSTKKLVAAVGMRKAAVPQVMNPLLDCMGILVNQACNLFSQESAFSEKSYETLGHLIDINQGLLNAIHVGHPKLDRIVEIAQKYNLHAKLTGAGGGGCAFIIIPEKTTTQVLKNLENDLQKESFTVYETSTEPEGVVLFK